MIVCDVCEGRVFFLRALYMCMGVCLNVCVACLRVCLHACVCVRVCFLFVCVSIVSCPRCVGGDEVALCAR